MSEISVLSDQYNRLVATSDKINNSVIALKKRSLMKEQGKAKYPKMKITPEELATASDVLLRFLENVSKVIEGDAQESEFIPSLIFDDYKNRITSNQFLLEDLHDLIAKLKIKGDIESKNISVLDDLLSVLDIERSALFRRLRTARG